MVNAIDCATKLTAATANGLKQSGVTAVGRYLPTQAWKGLTTDEVNAIKAAGLQLWSIYEKGGTSVSHFSAAQGQSDAYDAYKLAQSLGQPEGSAIYFAVDYDAKPSDMDDIEAYFRTVKATLKSYKVGIYGKYDVLTYIQSKNIVDYYWQTCAWSHGQWVNFKHLCQYQVDKPFNGINVDFVNIEQANFGAWGQTQAQSQQLGFIMVVKALGPCDIRDNPSHDAGFIRNTDVGELFNVISIQNDWHQVAVTDSQVGWIDGNNGQNLYWVDNPALKTVQPVYYVIKSGDTLSKIAAANGTTTSQLQTWNSIKNPNTIYAGQKIRVK